MLGLAVAGAALSGCAQPKIAGDGRAVDAPDRIPALVRQAETPGSPGNRPGAEGLADLIRALDDDDPAVRMFASQGLRERTGQDFGYRYFDSAQRRRPAVRAWRDWLDEQNNAPGTPDPSSPGPATTADADHDPNP